MITSKNKKLKSLLESRNGLHLSAFIRFEGDQVRFRKKLNELLAPVEDHASWVLNTTEKRQFLAPVLALAEDSENLKKIRGNIAIFRRHGFFGCISFPTECEEICVLASTFHIKPLIKWAQQDQDFLIIGLTSDGVSVYKGSQFEFRKVENSIYLKSLNWFRESALENDTKVFVVGQKDYVTSFMSRFNSDNLYQKNIAPWFTPENVYEVCRNVRGILHRNSRARINFALKEFQISLQNGPSKTNIFQIAEEAINGNVKKLVIAEDLNVFGKLDITSGKVALHTADLDHEDDCLLDDLAQVVLLNGGEVVVAKVNDIPKQKPIIALLKSHPHVHYAKPTFPQMIAV